MRPNTSGTSGWRFTDLAVPGQPGSRSAKSRLLGRPILDFIAGQNSTFDSLTFPRLLRLLAHRTANEFVAAPLASDLGLNTDTVRDYIGLFESIFFHHSIPAWTPGTTGRVVHRPKIHVVDSGIAAHLSGHDAGRLAQVGNTTSGPLLESFVAGEIQRHIPWSGEQPSLHHYRDKARREVDLVLETRDGRPGDRLTSIPIGALWTGR